MLFHQSIFTVIIYDLPFSISHYYVSWRYLDRYGPVSWVIFVTFLELLFFLLRIFPCFLSIRPHTLCYGRSSSQANSYWFKTDHWSIKLTVGFLLNTQTNEFISFVGNEPSIYWSIRQLSLGLNYAHITDLLFERLGRLDRFSIYCLNRVHLQVLFYFCPFPIAKYSPIHYNVQFYALLYCIDSFYRSFTTLPMIIIFHFWPFGNFITPWFVSSCLWGWVYHLRLVPPYFWISLSIDQLSK